MKKNTAGQSIGAQMLTAADGTPFTGAVTVYVTGDNGTQAVGTVGSGACVHKGNGYHSYEPSQAETNYDHVAFTFVGVGAVPATVQAITRELALDGVLAAGTLSGVHTATTADLGANAPATDVSDMVLFIPARGFVRIIDSYDTGTGAATFGSTSAALADGDQWYLFATPSASESSPVPANVKLVNDITIIGDGSSGNKFRGNP